MSDWISFWDTPHSIYVNARHRDVHYRQIAEDVRFYVPAPDAVVMDYGCGEALHADLVAAAAGRLILVEAAPGVVKGLTTRFAGDLSADALAAVLVQFRRLLRPNGLLIVGDIIPPDLSAWADVRALLRLASANGFLGAAVIGLARTVASDYARLRTTLGLARYDEPTMLAILAAAGFSGRRGAANIGHNQQRMTFLARPR
jgi:hypothetical protein